MPGGPTQSARPPRVLLHTRDSAPLAEKLAGRFPGAEIAECNDYDGLAAMVEEFKPDVVYSVRFAGSEGFPLEALLGPGGPPWVSNAGVGVDHLGRWDTSRTTVTNAAGVAADMMAEYVFGGFLHFTLDVPGLQADKGRRHWDALRHVRPLKGRTLLIVGLGHTGQAVAALGKAFGMRVVGTRARPRKMEGVDEVHAASELISLLPRADFVAVSTPLTPETRGLVGKREIAAMKPGAVLADVSRGGVVDQTALVEALNSGHVAGAALDVFETEPLPQGHPMWDMEKVLLSPHCSAVHAAWEEDSFELFLANLDRWMHGKPLMNVVDPARGY